MRITIGNFMQDGSFKYVKLIFFLCLPFFVFSQEEIYKHLDNYVASPSFETTKKFELFLNSLSVEKLNSKSKLAYAISKCNLGFFQNKQGNIFAAIKSYKQSEQIILKNDLKGYNSTENISLPLAKLYLKSGNFESAQWYAEQVLLEANTKKDTLTAINASILLSNAYNQISNYTSANKILKKTIPLCENRPNLQLQTYTNLASNQMAMGELDTAENSLKKVAKLSLNPNYYKALALLKVKQNKLDQASLYFGKAKQLLLKKSTSKREFAKLHLEEAQLWLLQNNVYKAQKLLNKTSEILLFGQRLQNIPTSILYGEPLLIDLFSTAAKAFPEQQRYFLDLCLRIYDLQIQSQQSKKHQIAYQSARKVMVEEIIENMYFDYETNKQESVFNTIFQYIEESKATQFTKFSQKKKLLQKYPNHPLLQKENILLQKREQLISNAYLKNIDISSAFKLLNSDIEKIQQQIALEFKEDLHSILSIQKLKEKLNTKNASCISFFYGKKHLYWVSIGIKNEIKKIELSSTFRENLNTYIHFFDNANAINNNLPKFTGNGFLNYKNFQFPKFKDRLLVIPDGILSFVPFEALLTSKTATTSFQKMPFLVKQTQIVYSNTALQYLQQPKENILKKKSIKTLGLFPVFENDINFNELKNSEREAFSISKKFKPKLFFREQASKKRFLKNIRDYNLIHLCTHAKGGDFTTNGFIRFYDASLFTPEIEQLNLKDKFLILSACETGVGKIIKSQAPESIAHSFQKAGATNTLFSLWEINDASTASFMNHFYENLSQTKSISFSNQNAKLNYLESNTIQNSRKSPYYWSAFVYYGDFFEADYYNFPIWIVFIGLIILAIVFWKFILN